MGQKRGDTSNLAREQESPSSQYDVLFVTRPAYTILSRRLPESHSYRIASNLIEGREMVSSYRYFAVVTDESSIARKSAERSVPFILLDSNPKPIILDLVSKCPNSYLLDPTKKDFVPEFGLLAKKILESYHFSELEPEADIQGQKHTLLIVDDDENALLLYKQRFEDEGYETVTASTIEGAVSLINCQEGIDLVITDYGLDSLKSPSGGLQLIQTIKLAKPEMPVILYTGYKSRTVLEFAKQIGAYDALTKSSDLEPLINSVANALRETKQEATTQTGGTLREIVERLDQQITENAEEATEELEEKTQG